MMNILKVIENDLTRDFVKELINLGMSEISMNTDSILARFPFVSGALAIYECCLTLRDKFLLKDLADFYNGVYESNRDNDIVIKNVDKGGHASDLLAEFTLRLISNNNKPGQVRILGWLFYAKAAGDITEDDYMRLCVFVNNCFVNDLKRLDEFSKENRNCDFIAESFYNAGLLDITDMIWDGGSICKFSVLGKKFYKILKLHNFFDSDFCVKTK